MQIGWWKSVHLLNEVGHWLAFGALYRAIPPSEKSYLILGTPA